jgi:iron complex transport system permease protein
VQLVVDTDEPRRAPRVAPRAAGLLLAAVVLALVVLLSLWVGSKGIPVSVTWSVLWHHDGSAEAVIVHDLRVPRTLLGLSVGAALGIAGALMQALTRNPLADPGLLGVNQGASAAVATAIVFFGVTSPGGYVWFALGGAAVVSVLVYVLGSQGRSTATPERLVLAGAALTAVLLSYTSGVLLLFPRSFDAFRFWNVGSVAGRKIDVFVQIAPFIAVGLLLAFALARSLNVLALGEETGKALGANLGRTRLLGAIAVTLLCGGATAAIGPITFIGLTVPHVARMIGGADQRWVLPYSALLAPILLLGSDVLGRVVVAPAEMEVGIVTALVGAPVFIALCRRRKLGSL